MQKQLANEDYDTTTMKAKMKTLERQNAALRDKFVVAMSSYKDHRGPEGEEGPAGPDGRQGLTGSPGKPGKQGPPGTVPRKLLREAREGDDALKIASRDNSVVRALEERVSEMAVHMRQLTASLGKLESAKRRMADTAAYSSAGTPQMAASAQLFYTAAAAGQQQASSLPAAKPSLQALSTRHGGVAGGGDAGVGRGVWGGEAVKHPRRPTAWVHTLDAWEARQRQRRKGRAAASRADQGGANSKSVSGGGWLGELGALFGDDEKPR